MTRLIISGEYSADWATIALQTKDEAGWRCVRCVHPFCRESGHALACDDQCDPRRCRAQRIADRHGSHNFGVHHLDGDKGNNAWWNKLALCNSCHLYVQASVVPERLFMFEHSPWFVPYVCGYYAHAAGCDISRAEAIAEPSKWLLLGQPWLAAAGAHS